MVLGGVEVYLLCEVYDFVKNDVIVTIKSNYDVICEWLSQKSITESIDIHKVATFAFQDHKPRVYVLNQIRYQGRKSYTIDTNSYQNCVLLST